METVSEGAQAGRRPGGQAGEQRAGRSGEGARSALEQLIQQERRRDAQLPRDEAEDAPPSPQDRP